jgi:endo-1,4-beta-xylanase
MLDFVHNRTRVNALFSEVCKKLFPLTNLFFENCLWEVGMSDNARRRNSIWPHRVTFSFFGGIRMRRFKGKVLSIATFLVTALLLSATQESSAQTITSSQQGSHGGYFYSFWRNSTGSASMTLGSGGNYSCSWSNVGNFTAGKGWKPGSSSRRVGYNCGHWSCNGGGVFGLYGWTTNPLIEYYVNEKWGSSRPTGQNNYGNMTSDGGTYTIYRTQRVNAPSIQGTKTFYQYFSTRTSQNGSGNKVITFANHVNAWAGKGLTLGSHDYQILLSEGYNSSGGSNATVWQQ